MGTLFLVYTYLERKEMEINVVDLWEYRFKMWPWDCAFGWGQYLIKRLCVFQGVFAKGP